MEDQLRSSVKEVRRDRRLTQSELAEAIGVSRQTIISLEGDGYAPSVVVALKLADVLQCRVDDLFTLVGTKQPEPERNRS